MIYLYVGIGIIVVGLILAVALTVYYVDQSIKLLKQWCSFLEGELLFVKKWYLGIDDLSEDDQNENDHSEEDSGDY